MQYLTEAKEIWRLYVPKSGQSETVQGELLRAVEKLRDEAIRNGNCNWDTGFEILVDYLKDHLLDSAVYPPHVIPQTRQQISQVENPDAVCLDDAVYDLLTDRVVEYFRHYGTMAHQRNPALHR
jgi:hypothetical protein